MKKKRVSPIGGVLPKVIPKGYAIKAKGRKTSPFWMIWFDHERKRATIHRYPDEKVRDHNLEMYPGSISYDDLQSEKIKEIVQKRRAAKLSETRVVEDVEPQELARAAGVTQKTARRWIEVGGAPRHAHDVAVALAMGDAVYTEPRPGKGARVKQSTLDKLGKSMAKFVEAVREGEESKKIGRLYAVWYERKSYVRSRLSRKQWASWIEEMGEELDLPDIGVFSKEHFRKS